MLEYVAHQELHCVLPPVPVNLGKIARIDNFKLFTAQCQLLLFYSWKCVKYFILFLNEYFIPKTVYQNIIILEWIWVKLYDILQN